jgi:hypothetical protein
MLQRHKKALEAHLHPPPDNLRIEAIDVPDGGMLILIDVPPQPEERNTLARLLVGLCTSPRSSRDSCSNLRCRLLHTPAQLVSSRRRQRLRLPDHWPWTTQFLAALAKINTLTAPT